MLLCFLSLLGVNFDLSTPDIQMNNWKEKMSSSVITLYQILMFYKMHMKSVRSFTMHLKNSAWKSLSKNKQGTLVKEKMF